MLQTYSIVCSLSLGCMWKNTVFSHPSKLRTGGSLVHNVHSFELHEFFLASHVIGYCWATSKYLRSRAHLVADFDQCRHQ